MKKPIPFREMADNWRADPDFQREYDALAEEFELAAAVIRARTEAVAERTGGVHGGDVERDDRLRAQGRGHEGHSRVPMRSASRATPCAAHQ